MIVWSERKLSDPTVLVDGYGRNDFKDLKLTRGLPVGVIVSESAGGLPPGDPHAGMFNREQTPRLVVYGNARFISDQPLPGGLRVTQVGMELYYSLFASSIAWLRERPNSIGIEPKKRDEYKMNENTNIGRLLWLPAGLMGITIVGLGLGVWVVRRR
jgi:hypothetical protein